MPLFAYQNTAIAMNFFFFSRKTDPIFRKYIEMNLEKIEIEISKSLDSQMVIFKLFILTLVS